MVLDAARLHWRDAVASVTITAVGPSGHTANGIRTIGKRMVVVPQTVLDRVVARSPGHPRSVIALEPLAFPVAGVSLPQSLGSKLGRSGIQIKTPQESVGNGVCWGCEQVGFVSGWRQDGVTYTVIAMPPKATIVGARQGIRVERIFDPAAGSDMVLLSTTDTHRHVTVSAPGQPPVTIQIAETTL